MNQQEIQSIKQRFEIVGNSPQLNYAVQVAATVAPTDLTVLITGESGSGKESFSKIIHNLSARKFGQFIAINCGAIPEGTIDSELFGHEKGSFTGATEARKGYFEVTNSGTIFLDEIGEMPLGTQARLLRVLENGEFIKVGSSKVQKTDVRVVAATNVNLLDAVAKGRFREDLYYRLNTVPISVPALRERGEDADLLFRKFAQDFAERYRVKPVRLLPEARTMLLRYRFPGNIRQLKNLVDQLSVLEVERDITPEVLSRHLPDIENSNLPATVGSKGGEFSFAERELLYQILFDMRRDMAELKRLVFEALQNENYGPELLQKNAEIFRNMNNMGGMAGMAGMAPGAAPDYRPATVPGNGSPFIIDPPVHAAPPVQAQPFYEEPPIEDISHESAEESLSLDAKEKEMILKALRKNNNKRKYAAMDLGISERTLYRKIKEYDIDA